MCTSITDDDFISRLLRKLVRGFAGPALTCWCEITWQHIWACLATDLQLLYCAGASDYWNWVFYNLLMQLDLPLDPVFGHPLHTLQPVGTQPTHSAATAAHQSQPQKKGQQGPQKEQQQQQQQQQGSALNEQAKPTPEPHAQADAKQPDKRQAHIGQTMHHAHVWASGTHKTPSRAELAKQALQQQTEAASAVEAQQTAQQEPVSV